LIIVLDQAREGKVADIVIGVALRYVDEVLLAYFLFRVLGHLISKSRQFLILTELELHLFVSKELAQCTVVE